MTSWVQTLADVLVALMAYAAWSLLTLIALSFYGFKPLIVPFTPDKVARWRELPCGKFLLLNGFLVDGLGIFIAFTAFDYLSWKHNTGSTHDLAASVIGNLAVGTMVAVGVGLSVWKKIQDPKFDQDTIGESLNSRS